jgi:hypothetical protein
MTVQPLITYAGQGNGRLQIIDLNSIEELAVTCPSVSVTPPATTNHSCIAGVCTPDIAGIYPTLQDCINSGCAAPPSGGGGGLIMLLGIGLLGIVMTSKKGK